MNDEKTAFLKGVPLFERLSDAHLESLAELLVERKYGRSDVVVFEGDPGDALFIVRSGAVKICTMAEDGREKTLAILGKGEFFGEMSLFDGAPRSASVEALEPTVLHVLHRSDFLKALLENSSMALEIIRVLSERLRKSNAQILDVAFRDVRGRIVRVLSDLAAKHGTPVADGGLKIDLKLTHQELANYVGTARETVSRVLAELQDSNLIRVDGRYIVLKDTATLDAYASGM